jgi:hypothetical protein
MNRIDYKIDDVIDKEIYLKLVLKQMTLPRIMNKLIDNIPDLVNNHMVIPNIETIL